MGAELVPVDPGKNPPEPDQELIREERDAFIAYLEEHPKCSVKEAAYAAVETVNETIDDEDSKRRVKGKKRMFRALLGADPEFASNYREARGYGDDTIREAIRERAIEGISEPILGKDGEVVGQKTVYSDRLLIELARANLGEYKDVRRLELTGRDGGPIEVEKAEVSLDAVLDVLYAVGAVPRPGEADLQSVPALAGTREILPAPAEPEASGLPPDRQP